VAVRLPRGILAQIDAWAAKNGMKRSDAIREFLPMHSRKAKSDRRYPKVSKHFAFAGQYPQASSDAAG
jgi:hypothetical protein